MVGGQYLSSKKKVGQTDKMKNFKKGRQSDKMAAEYSSSSRVIMEKKVDNILIKVLDCAFIEREQVDVIVNSISPTLHLSGRKLSSAIGATAGPGLQRALQALPDRPKVGDVLVTPGFGLRSKYVYHVVATGYYKESSESLMEKSVLRCLNMANTNGMSSIAIPALGSGGQGFEPKVVATRMLRALTKFQKTVGSSPNLREVRFALIETAIRVAFIKELSKQDMKLTIDQQPSFDGDGPETPDINGRGQSDGRNLERPDSWPTSWSQLSEYYGQSDEDWPSYQSVPITPTPRQGTGLLESSLPPAILQQIKGTHMRRSHSLQDPFIPWRWTGMVDPGPNHRESEWLDALQEDLFMIRPRSPIVLHGATGIGKTRFLEEIQELWGQGSLPKFSCVLLVSGLGVLSTGSLWKVIWNHVVEKVGLLEPQATDLLTVHASGVLVLLDDADLVSSDVLKQTRDNRDLSNMNFVFAVRTPEALRLTQCLDPSDIVELKCFTSLEVERYAAKSLEGALEDVHSVIQCLIQPQNMHITSIPGNLKRVCNLVKRQPSTNLQTHLRGLHDMWSACLKAEPRETIKNSTPDKSWFDHLQGEGSTLGKVFYDFLTLDTKPLAPFWLQYVTDRDGFVIRHVLDFAIAKHISSLASEQRSLLGCTALQTCFGLQTSLQLSCGMSQKAASIVQKHILSLDEKDISVRRARAKVLELEDDEGAVILNLLADLEGGCRREANVSSYMEELEGVPVELQHLGPEYVLAYQRACSDGSQSVYRTRVMLVGHFGAGKTSLKHRLVNEPFDAEYITTNGIEADPSACKIVIDNTCNWKLLDRGSESGDEYTKEVAKLLHRLMQRLRPAQVKRRELSTKTDNVESIISEIGDQMQATYGPWFDMAMKSYRKDSEPSIPDAGALANEEADDPNQDQLDVHDDLLLAKIPPEVLRELRSLIRSLEVGAHPQPQETEARLSFWDFAGQTVFYTTHQTFLTHRAIYIVVLDLTRPLETPIYTYRQGRHGKTLDKTCPQTVADYLDYWLNCIHTHAMSREFNPTSPTLSPPIIIVGTHRDVIEQQYPDTAKDRIDSYYDTVHKYIERKAYFDHVHLQFFSVANNCEDDSELNNLKQKIITLAQKEPYWGEKIPLRWTALRDRLRQVRQSGVSVTDQAQVLKEAQEVGILDKDELCTVLRFYHELGDLVYFDEPNLRDFIVLDPQWLIDSFRKVITINHFHEQHEFPNGRRHWRILEEHGVLHDSILDHVWEPGRKEQLTTLMFKFRLLLPMPFSKLIDICPEVRDVQHQPDVSYLVPCLLPPLNDLPELPDSLPPVLFIFREDFLPVGVTSRIVTGLVTEEKWTLSGKVFHNFATFLPGGVDGGVIISMCQKEGLLELQGRFLGDSQQSTGAVFRPYLMAFQRLLCSIVETVCPVAHFTLAVWCRCRREQQDCRTVEVGLQGEQLEGKERVYCRHHWNKFSTSHFAHWFNVAFPITLADPVQDEYPSDRTLLQLSEGIGIDWQKVAIYLGLTYQQVQQARMSNPHDIISCIHSLLIRWRNKCTLKGPQRIQELQEALRNADRADLAQSLKCLP